MDLRTSRSLELLASFVQTVGEFAAREEQFAKTFRTRRQAANRKRNDALARIDAHLAAQIEEADADFSRQLEAAHALHATRGERIQRTHNKCIRDVLTLARRKKEKWLNDLQLRHFHAKRQLPLDFKAADSELAAFFERLAVERAALMEIRDRTQRAFGGYPSFSRLLSRGAESSAAGGADRDRLLDELRAAIETTGRHLVEFRALVLPRLFSIVPPILIIVLLLIGGGVFAFRLGFDPVAFGIAGAVVAASLAVIFAIHFAGRRQGMASATAVADLLIEAVRLHDACAAAAQAKDADDRARIQRGYDQLGTDIREQWSRGDEIETEISAAARTKISSQVPRLLSKNEALHQARLQRIESLRAARFAEIDAAADVQRAEFAEVGDAGVAEVGDEEHEQWAAIDREWRSRMTSLHEAVAEMNAAAHFPAWGSGFVETWKPATDFVAATKFGRLDLDLSALPGGHPQQLELPGDPHVSIPLALEFPGQGSMLFEMGAGDSIKPTLNSVVLRLLAAMPAGKVSFTVIDPVGLGQDFGGLMHLGDYEESLINRRIWTQRDQIEDRLAELNEHIEKVIQMYLRDEYASISEYNAQAGSVAEKYYFVVIADFPAGFSEMAAKRLQSIIVSGPRCGVFTLIHWDVRQPLPDGFSADELRKSGVRLVREANGWLLTPEQAAVSALVFDPPPEQEVALALVHKIGKASIDSNRVEVPFTHVIPRPDDMWTGDTTTEVRVAIGRTGATKLQYLAIGKGTKQHALFAGKTGSGKSTLFHVIITNLALCCSPDQVEFYLIDFKKGVEFKCYATSGLPHARVVAIESDREFGLSVLQRVDDELKRRGDMFRKLGVQDIPGYKRVGGTEPMPRVLLMIDEFQEFFTEDDEIAQTASLLFDRIVRQGRAFGIHVLLGSQTLGGAYTLARATLGQMVIRVALQCNEADAYLIMDENNSAPRLLSRPGEGIYNDAAGAVEGNSPFQVVWLSDEERDRWLSHVSLLAAKHHDTHPGPIVFEGNAPAEIRENRALAAALESKPLALPPAARVWLGAPNSIKGPTEAVFQRQAGNHLLVVGQREESALTMLGVGLISLAAQHPIGTAKFILLHSATPGSSDAEFLERICAAIPHGVRAIGGLEVPAVMREVAEELKARGNGESVHGVSIFVLIHGLQRFKKLRQEDDFDFSSDAGTSPGAQFTALITEGSTHGIHLIATVDTYNNVTRFLSRKAQSEIEMRVVFQMSVNDSASLIDTPKASTLGLHRALLYNEQQGTLETFRPYAMPDAEWIAEVAAKLAHKAM
ncbi:MAG: FtsK/SpoIIIE domain-containing protein [Chthoniobacteraceae bacterium]